MYSTGRDMPLVHKGMRISESDWVLLRGHVTATLEHFHVPEAETQPVLAFIDSTKADIGEVAELMAVPGAALALAMLSRR